MLKGNCTCTKGFQRCHQLKMNFQEVKGMSWHFGSAQTLVSPRPCMFVHLGKPFSSQLMLFGHLVHSFKFLHRPTGRFCHQLHVLGLSQCMHDMYQMNLEYVPYRNISDFLFFLCSVILEHSSLHNVLNLIRVPQKRRILLPDEKWKLDTVFFLPFIF